MRLYSLIFIMHAQFGTQTSTKNLKQSYELFKTNAYVSSFNYIIQPIQGLKTHDLDFYRNYIIRYHLQNYRLLILL